MLLEESIIGWKEYELEVMRDTADNVVIICSIENLDPMGVHTGDSITVAPAMTLTDREYQAMRDMAIGIIRSVGVDTGGCNIQYAVNPADGRLIVIEMNPRVSRSSALASKATGFPIAKIAAKVAIGYTLDEIRNDITQETPASFEPSLDYVVVKVPRFAFEKFSGADPTLTTHMKSVGEAMAIGRNFTESLQKALRSLESKGAIFDFASPVGRQGGAARQDRGIPTDGRLRTVMDAIRAGATPEELFDATKIDPWFVDQLFLINEVADDIAAADELDHETLRTAKRHGFSDAQIAAIRGMREDVVRGVRQALGLRPVYKTVDTCAAEFAAQTPYHYSSYDEETEVQPRAEGKEAVIILGSGPNRIGQGIEFDYSCVHASLALGEAGYETIMVNCNPETVSTDYDTSDRLYFEPLTLEDVLEVVHAEQQAGPVAGVICQLGGQTPLGLAQGLEDAGVPIVGTSPEAIHLAEERGAFGRVLGEAGLTAPKRGMATSFAEAKPIADESATRCWSGRGLRVRRSRHGDRLQRRELAPHRPRDRDLRRPAGPGRPLPRRRGRDRRRRALRRPLFLGGVWSTSRRPALTPATGPRAPADHPQVTRRSNGSARHRGDRPGRRRARPVNIQYALAADALYVLEANPRASPHGALRLQGDRDAAAEAAARVMLGDRRRTAGRGPAARARRRRPARRRADRGQGGGDAVQPVPHRRRHPRRHDPRPGDAVHRRGDGLRHGLRHRVREVPGRGVRLAADLGPSSSRWPTATSGS